MESEGKDRACPDSSSSPSAACEEPAVPDVITTRRLRDREQLQKRKAEAQENDLIQRLLREQRNKQQKTGRGAKRGRGRQRVVKFSQKPEPKPDPLPDSQEEAEPGPAKLALSELEHQEELPVLTIQDLASVMEPEAVEKELAAGIQDPAGEEKVLKPEEAEIPEDWNVPLESDQEDN